MSFHVRLSPRYSEFSWIRIKNVSKRSFVRLLRLRGDDLLSCAGPLNALVSTQSDTNSMNESVDTIEDLIAKATDGCEESLAALFGRYRSQLRRMVSFRMDHNLKGRIDPSDVLQDAFLDLQQRLPQFDQKGMSFFVWLRLVTRERLLRSHREHLGARMRDARREVSMNNSVRGPVSSVCLAAHLLGKYSSVAGKAIKAEQSVQLKAVLDRMDDADREIIGLRIFEGLTNGEAAEVLELTKQTVSKRFIRAITRLKDEMGEMAGFNDQLNSMG